MKDIEEYLTQFDQQAIILLAEVASILKPRASEFERTWLASYQELAGDHPGISEQRAAQLIARLLALFVQHITEANLAGYFEGVEHMGAEAASSGIPYGDLMMVIHQYEELTTPFLIERYTIKEQLRMVLSSLDRLYHAAIAIIASAYFRDTLGQLRASNQSLETMGRLSNSIVGTLEVSELTQKIVDAIPQGFPTRAGVKGGMLCMIDSETHDLLPSNITSGLWSPSGHLRGTSELPAAVHLTADSLVREAAITGESQYSERLSDFLGAHESSRAPFRFRQLLEANQGVAVPVCSRGSVVGVLLFVLSEEARGVQPADQQLMLAFADTVGAALGNAALFEEAVRQRVRAEAVTNVSPDGILVCNADKVVVSVNPAMEALTGYSAGELLGRVCRYALGAKDTSGTYLCDGICPFISRPTGELSPADATLTRKDGRQIWVEARFGTMREQDGAITGVVHSFRDITERKNTERLRDELLSIATHELRTPITSVKGYAQLLLRRLGNTPEVANERRPLEIIDRQLDRMIGLINELLEMSRLQTGRLQLDLHLVDLQELATDVIDRLQVTTNCHTFHVAGTGSKFVLADRFRIDQVLTNMVSNAIRYSPEGGDIDLRVEYLGDEVAVSVTDHGMGIPEEEQGRIFDQFYQVRSGQRAGGSGMGLGLYISEQIVRLHGGKIGVKSQPGQGSTFYFAIPIGQATSTIAPSESAVSRESAG